MEEQPSGVKTMNKLALQVVAENIKDLESRLDAIKNQITALQGFLVSSKFHLDPTIQVNDVLTMLANLKGLTIE